MKSNLCSRGVYGCKHDEGHIATRENVLWYFADHDGYVLSRHLNEYFGCCERTRTDALTSVLSYLQHVTKEIVCVSASAWAVAGSTHPKVQTQKALLFSELPPGKVHLLERGVMIHDRNGALLYEYVSTENVSEVTCGLCLNILKARSRHTHSV